MCSDSVKEVLVVGVRRVLAILSLQMSFAFKTRNRGCTRQFTRLPVLFKLGGEQTLTGSVSVRVSLLDSWGRFRGHTNGGIARAMVEGGSEMVMNREY